MLPFERQLNNGKIEKYYVEDTHEKIIDEETFSKVQKLINSRQRVCTRQKRLFTDLIVCGQCGRSFRRTVKNYKVYWVCRNHDENKNKCSVMPIPEIALQNAYIRMFNKLKRFGDKIISPAIS